MVASRAVAYHASSSPDLVSLLSATRLDWEQARRRRQNVSPQRGGSSEMCFLRGAADACAVGSGATMPPIRGGPRAWRRLIPTEAALFVKL